MNKATGFTLIELIIFILVIGITATASLLAFNTVATESNRPGQLMAASQLANARMNIIILQRLTNGFANISDPCASGTPPAACIILANFASSAGLTVNSSFSSGGGIATATVNVSGRGSAQVVARFVQ